MLQYSWYTVAFKLDTVHLCLKKHQYFFLISVNNILYPLSTASHSLNIRTIQYHQTFENGEVRFKKIQHKTTVRPLQKGTNPKINQCSTF